MAVTDGSEEPLHFDRDRGVRATVDLLFESSEPRARLRVEAARAEARMNFLQPVGEGAKILLPLGCALSGRSRSREKESERELGRLSGGLRLLPSVFRSCGRDRVDAIAAGFHSASGASWLQRSPSGRL